MVNLKTEQVLESKIQMLDYKSLSSEELRLILASAGAELISRRNTSVNGTSKQHQYRLSMRRTSKAEPEAFRFTLLDGAVVQIPLSLDQVIGTTGKVIGGEFLLDDGDVIQKVYSSGIISYTIAWQGFLERQDYDVSKVLEGDTEAETIAKIEQFVLGDRTLLVQELAETIAFWREHVAEYEAKRQAGGPYSTRVATEDRIRISRLEAMLDWALSNGAGACTKMAGCERDNGNEFNLDVW